MRLPERFIPALLCVIVPGAAFGASPVRFQELPEIPGTLGLGGPFVGVVNDHLIVAGGTNFPAGPLWEGGKKRWYDDIYVLDSPDGSWRKAKEKLPRPLAYGVTISDGRGMVCIGGSDAKQHYADVFAIGLPDGRISFHTHPSLPRPCAMMCGAVLNGSIYVAGGIESPDATRAMHTFWCWRSIRGKRAPWTKHWEELDAWPGRERHLAVAGVVDNAFYITGGIRLKEGDDAKPAQVVPYLSDTYRYEEHPGPKTVEDVRTYGPVGKWTKVADLPRATAAAASPAMTLGHELLIFSGIDHTNLGRDPKTYPPFPRTVFSYDARANRWSSYAPMPEGTSRVTAGATSWQGGYVIACGEIGPCRRSPKVYWIRRQGDP